MCVDGCLQKVSETLDRRGLLLGVSAAAGAAIMGSELSADESQSRNSFPSFNKVVDLTHPYDSRFPHVRGGAAVVEVKANKSTAKGDKWNVNTWTIDEHAGTHIDAPIHKNAKGITVEKIPAEDLVLPLAVIDIRDKARKDHDALVTVDDLVAWEKQHGILPKRCCVAMNSGWEARLNPAKPFPNGFINVDRGGVKHFPGFDIRAAEMLFHERSVVALATDTPSLDHGATQDFPVHVLWLGGNRYGLENVASLSNVPPKGATLVAGAPKVTGASGGPTRILALT